jgi:hypothetical protein
MWIAAWPAAHVTRDFICRDPSLARGYADLLGGNVTAIIGAPRAHCLLGAPVRANASNTLDSVCRRYTKAANKQRNHDGSQRALTVKRSIQVEDHGAERQPNLLHVVGRSRDQQ